LSNDEYSPQRRRGAKIKGDGEREGQKD
jgi:hypothetical protein